MRAAEEAAFREYVAARMERLRRTAFLYCRDWHTADDLVSTTLVKLYQHWQRAQQAGSLDAYVYGILAHAWLDERRRPWRREQVVPELPDHDSPGPTGRTPTCSPCWRACRPAGAPVWSSASTATCPSSRPPRSSASRPGTVKSQTARGLDMLRGPAIELFQE